jgi:hypothetical protein
MKIMKFLYFSLLWLFTLANSAFAEETLALSFNQSSWHLGNMKTPVVIAFSVEASVDYELSTPATGMLTNVFKNSNIDYAVVVDKANSLLTITPEYIDAAQHAGNYTGNISLSIQVVE